MRSTRSPGSARPLRPAISSIGMVMARLPLGSTAARKPRSPGCTTTERAIGTPCGSTWRATLPARNSCPAASATIISPLIALSVMSIRESRSGVMIVPIGTSRRRNEDLPQLRSRSLRHLGGAAGRSPCRT